MSAPSSAAACNSGASSAWARSVQWDPSPCDIRPGDDPTSTSDRAMESAALQVVDDCSGDHRRAAAPGGRSTDPVGSNRRHRPSCDRAPRVASITSDLVEVETTGPLLDHHVGNDQRRRLPRPRRSENHHRLFGTSEAPSPFGVPQIDAAPGTGGCAHRATEKREVAL